MKTSLYIFILLALIASSCTGIKNSIESRKQAKIKKQTALTDPIIRDAEIKTVIQTIDSLDIVDEVIMVNETVALDDKILIEYTKTPCLGRCPSFMLIVYKNGNIEYEGNMFVDKIGTFKGKIDLKITDPILAKANTIGFYNMEAEYDAGYTDIPTTILKINGDSTSHSVRDRWNGPTELHDLYTMLDQLIENINWHTPNE